MNKINVINQALSLYNKTTEYGLGIIDGDAIGADFKIQSKILDLELTLSVITYLNSSVLLLDTDYLEKRPFNHLIDSPIGDIDLIFLSDSTYASLVESNLDSLGSLKSLAGLMIEKEKLDFVPTAVVFVFHYVYTNETIHRMDKWRLFFLSAKQIKRLQSLVDKKKAEK